LDEVSNIVSIVLLLGFCEWVHVNLNFSSSLINLELFNVSSNWNLLGRSKELRIVVTFRLDISLYVFWLSWSFVFWDQNLSEDFIVLSSGAKRIF
jgi:hypothetical protein